MTFPAGIGIIDTLIGFPHKDMKETYAFITNQTKDPQSKEDFGFPVEYMFKDVPEKHSRRRRPDRGDALRRWTTGASSRGLIGVGTEAGRARWP